jgi:hypothetical protein
MNLPLSSCQSTNLNEGIEGSKKKYFLLASLRYSSLLTGVSGFDPITSFSITVVCVTTRADAHLDNSVKKKGKNQQHAPL